MTIDLDSAHLLVRVLCTEHVCVDCPYSDRCVPMPGAEYVREIGLSVTELANVVHRTPIEPKSPEPEASVDW